MLPIKQPEQERIMNFLDVGINPFSSKLNFKSNGFCNFQKKAIFYEYFENESNGFVNFEKLEKFFKI